MAKRKKYGKRRRPRKNTFEGLKMLKPDAAGIDIGSASHFVAVPVDRDEQPVREFSAFTSGLHDLVDWLAACGVTTVAMEATGVYWVPLYDLLEERGFEAVLVNARHFRNAPGRKSDVADCQWLQQLHTYAAMNAGRSQTAIGGFYRRLGIRAGKGKAVVATAAKIARIIYTMIQKQCEYSEEGLDVYEKRYRYRVFRNLQRRAKELGFKFVEIEENSEVAGVVS